MSVTEALDPALRVIDEALRTLFAPAHSQRTADLPAEASLSEHEKRHAAGLMRVNHAGEVAAQGLYRGQALLSRSPETLDFLRRAATEEGEHLAWCESRLRELDSRPSRLNPLWYAGAFAIGAAAAALSDRVSLGFVEETERQVEGHLTGHLDKLPAGDARSRRLVELMRADEAGHAQAARAQGGRTLPPPIPALMRAAAAVMTGTAYWI
jgi:ubiquinone biosynthesis monooxygenase Coq7